MTTFGWLLVAAILNGSGEGQIYPIRLFTGNDAPVECALTQEKLTQATVLHESIEAASYSCVPLFPNPNFKPALKPDEKQS